MCLLLPENGGFKVSARCGFGGGGAKCGFRIKVDDDEEHSPDIEEAIDENNGGLVWF
ncbi:hypothetical protein Hanom_Chr09g00793621 [Helianthus anomalus]